MDDCFLKYEARISWKTTILKNFPIYLVKMNMMLYILFRGRVMSLEWIKHAPENTESNHIAQFSIKITILVFSFCFATGF